MVGWLVMDWRGTHLTGAGSPSYCPASAGAPDLGAGKFRGKEGGRALREAPPTPPNAPPPATGMSWSQEVGEPGDCPRCHRLSQRPRLGCQSSGLGAARLGEACHRGAHYPGRPVPGPAALWTPGWLSPGARLAPAPRRPRAGPLGAQAGSCARCPRLRWVVEAVREQSCVPRACAP